MVDLLVEATVAQLEVKLKEGWCDMGMFKKVLNAVSPVASVINKSGPVAKMLGMEKKKGIKMPGRGTMGSMMASLANDPKAQNALEQGKARVAPVKAAGMKKGGKVKSGSSASKRADGCAVKGKTRGRMV